MNLAHLLEALMLVCFGFSWPINVVKAIKAKTAKSTSLAFICLIITGYIGGIAAKIISGQFNYVLVVYFINLAIVTVNAFVYFRNKAIDKRKNEVSKDSIRFKTDVTQKEKFAFANVEYYDYIPKNARVASEKKYNITLFGGSYDNVLPVKQLENDFEFDFELINKSISCLSVQKASEYYLMNIKNLESDGIIIHIGAEDVEMFRLNPSEFDNLYLNLLSTIKKVNKNCRLALVSILNPNNDTVIDSMNNHIKAIASSVQGVYVDLAYASLWNPKATKVSVDFAHNMGLNIKKPILDVAKIIYSYAVQNIAEDKKSENFAS